MSRSTNHVYLLENQYSLYYIHERVIKLLNVDNIMDQHEKNVKNYMP